MKILVVNPFGDTEFYGHENLARIARPDTEFDVVDIGDMYPLRNNQWLYFRYMCTDGTLETVMRAEKQGYDAVFISCNLDIGLYEARQLVDIPVTATLESAALVAHMMGCYLLSRDGGLPERQDPGVARAGRTASTSTSPRSARSTSTRTTSTSTRPRRARSSRQSCPAAKACVDEDGAEVVIPGCTLAGSVLTHDLPDAESVIGAPVLDGMVTGFKMAEMMADMRAAGVPTVSRRGWFEKPPKADMRTLRTFMGRES